MTAADADLEPHFFKETFSGPVDDAIAGFRCGVFDQFQDVVHRLGKDYVFYDCSKKPPSGRRSLCDDKKALKERKEHKPKNSAVEMAEEMGVEILSEEQYRKLQAHGEFDTKTSSWIQTPAEIRKLGGALFCDRRYDTVFVYHNGAQSYYAVRGFRGLLKV